MVMNKKSIAGSILVAVGAILLFGSLKLLPDLKPIGASLAVLALGVAVGLPAFLDKRWNTRMYVGAIGAVLGIVCALATVELLPDLKPLVSMSLVCVVGIALFFWGMLKAEVKISVNKSDGFNVFGWMVAAGLFTISLLLLPQINWQHPKDPAGVMVLCSFSAVLLVYALIRNHPAKRQVIWAGFIAVANFCLIPLYESGAADFIGKFYRLFIPLYEKFDSSAETVEWALIGATVILVMIFAIVFVVKKIRVRDYGNATLWYFALLPIMAIYLFEMMGLPAGFLAGSTTRSDLLFTDANAALSTFGILFIAVAMYMVFELFPFWVAPILAGLWWVYWKPWLLHHPNPEMFTSLEAFWPAAKFLFLTGMKRVALPMILLLPILSLLKRKK
jgi:hypothetical protein